MVLGCSGTAFHGTSNRSWEWAQLIGDIRPRQMGELRLELEKEFGLTPGSLDGPELQMYAQGVRADNVFVADSFYHACGHAGRGGNEAVLLLLGRAFHIAEGIDSRSAEASTRLERYLKDKGIRPVVLALDVPFEAIPDYRDSADPAAAWRAMHPPGVFLDFNLAVESPVPIGWVVAVIDPEEVDDADRLCDPNDANVAFLMSGAADGALRLVKELRESKSPSRRDRS